MFEWLKQHVMNPNS